MGRTGIVLYHGIDSGAELSGYSRLAEDAGFDSLWVTERYFHEETFSMLGYLAAKTDHIRLGVGVVNPYTRSPALLGMGAATIDRLSGGRLMLGLGRSDVEVIEGRMGMDYSAPLARLRGTVGALRSMWSGERVSSEYAGVRLRDVGLALRPLQDRLPIYMAAIGPRALRLAGEVADGALSECVRSGRVRAMGCAAEVRRAASEVGRDPGIGRRCVYADREAHGRSGVADAGSSRARGAAYLGAAHGRGAAWDGVGSTRRSSVR